MNPIAFLLIAGLQAYRWVISPAKNVLLGTAGCCRFTPTCSQYSLEAIRRHGAGRGAWMSVRRVCRCHPWGGAGTDPVPDLLRLPS